MTFPRGHLILALFGVAVSGCLGLAAWQMAGRVPYKWDLFIWSESPFLTDMLKIDAGQPVYTSPEQVNSFVYSPGLEYITYALLRPINRHLDIRYCRVVSIGFAVLASLAFARCSALLARESARQPQGRWFYPLSAAIFFLIIYHNFTSDVPHPDNLHICHLAVTMTLTFGAIRRPSAGRMALAVLFASSAVLLKQTAATSAVGVSVALVAFAPRKLGAASWLFPLAAAASLAALVGLWSIGRAKFYTFDVLSSHGIQKDRIPDLLRYLFEDYRSLPLGLSLAAILSGFRSRDQVLKKFLAAHLLIGLFEAAPAVLAFLKPMGNWNNLAVIEAWAAVPFVPLLLSLLRAETIEEDGRVGSGPVDGFARMTTVVLAFGLVYCYIPTKDRPQQAHYDYSRKIERSIAQDLKAGRRVLVAHGTEFLIRNRSRQIPLDRSNSFLELTVAGKGNLTGTEKRFREHYYDRIYLNSVWYPPELHLIMLANYREVARIPAPVDRSSTLQWGPHLIKYGFQNIHRETPVYEPRESPPVAAGASGAIGR